MTKQTNEFRTMIDNSSPVMKRTGAGKMIPVCFGKATISGTTAVITIAGLTTSDVAIATVTTGGTAGATTACTTDTLTITGTDTDVVDYVVYRV